MTNAGLLSPGGTVTVADRSFQVSKLPLQGEITLSQVLADGAKREYGPGGYFAKAGGALAWLRENGRGAEFGEAMRHLTHMEATGVMPSDEAVERFRQTAKGVATELFWRTRKSHPDVGLDHFEAVVTAMNAVETFLQIIDAITDAKKAPTPSDSPPT